MFFSRKKAPESDDALLLSFRSSHDLEALSTLYLRYADLIYGVCLKYLKDREAAKDAVMQIHEKLIDLIPRHEIIYFRSWLYTTARNHCLMQLRALKTHPQEDIEQLLMENALIEHPGSAEELENDLQRLEKCIETLMQEQQQCVRLFFLKEKCYRDISSMTGFEMKQVKSYIQNGKRNLKICMESNG